MSYDRWTVAGVHAGVKPNPERAHCLTRRVADAALQNMFWAESTEEGKGGGEGRGGGIAMVTAHNVECCKEVRNKETTRHKQLVVCSIFRSLGLICSLKGYRSTMIMMMVMMVTMGDAASHSTLCHVTPCEARSRPDR